MLVLETVLRIRREHASGKAIKAIARDLHLSRKVVRKAIRAPEADMAYRREVQPLPKLGPFQAQLDTLLEEDEARPRREKLRLTRIHDLLVREGFDGSYDAVRRYAARWRRTRRRNVMDAPAFIPLLFRPGEAYQFDWSHEDVEIAGKPMRVKVAHVRLCASRAMYVRAYPRETQEMLFDAHARAFAFFGGVPTRGIYDNMKTAVTSVFTGKERVFNRRFLVMANHYMVEPTACSPAAGWEKGQVENQVQTARGRFFQPRLRFASIEELNGWLEAECRRWADMHQHPEHKELTVAQAWAAECAVLQPIVVAPFDGFHESEHAVSGTCLISFDRNRYSVMAKAVRRTVQVRAYADRIVVRCDGEIVADHPRCFGRDRTIHDPWHYLPVLVTKPGALRNGAPFQDWELPPALAKLRRKLGTGDDADRRFVRVLSAVLDDGLEAVEAAAREALLAGVTSDDIILNILARHREPPRALAIATPEDLMLRHPPRADCNRYDSLRGIHATA